MKIHLALLLSASLAIGAEESFYKAPSLFSTAPDEKNPLTTIARFGPVGMGIELIPQFVGRNRDRLCALAALEVQSTQCGGASDPIDQLTGLHDRAGNDA